MGDSRNFAALDWVIGEISDTLKDARQALESFVEDPRDSTRMRFCLTHIHQVFGSLHMAEFHGASLLAEEMEHTAQAIINNDVSSIGEAQEVLMRAMLQLPIYLDHIRVSKEDHPGVVLPLLNDLRAVRKKSFLSETNLFLPNLDAAQPVSQPLHRVTQDPSKLAEVLKKLREMYQFAAASVLRGIDIDQNLAYLDKVMSKLELITRGTQSHATWEVAGALVDALKRDELELSVAVRGLLRYLARELRLISENAPETFNRQAPESLLKNLLYYVGKAQPTSEKVLKVREAYELEKAELNRSNSLGASDANMSAPDPEAIKSVVVALQDELNTIKHVLDLAVKGQAGVQNLEEMLPVVKRVGDTLAILGIGDLRKKIVEQIALIDEMVESNALDDEKLYEVAGKVIDVEHKLDAISKVVGKGNDLNSINEREIEIDHAKATVIVECRHGLDRAKDAIIEYVSSNWDVSHLENIGQQLVDIRGGLDIIPLPRPAAIMDSCNRFIQEDLLSGRSQPSWEKMETLADAMASVEYYLERLSTDLDIDADSLLDIAEGSVNSLGYPIQLDPTSKSDDTEQTDTLIETQQNPVPEHSVESDEQYESRASSSDLSTTESYDQLSHSSGAEKAQPVDDQPADIAVDGEHLSEAESDVQVPDDSPLPEPEVEQAEEQVDLAEAFAETPDQEPPPVSLDQVSLSDEDESESDIDDEIIEIFIEEAEEVLETLHEYFPKWRMDNSDSDSLVIVRRAFHTLKGSGRMVEAYDIGELAWSVENLLNRVLDKSIAHSDSHCEFIARVMKISPRLVQAFESKQPNPDKPLTEHLMKIGEELADGKTISDFSHIDQSLENLGQPHEQPPEEDYIVESSDVDTDEEDTSWSDGSTKSDKEEDDVLIEIFISEARAHLQTMNGFVGDMYAVAPIFMPPTDALQRALHTLKGSAKMANKMPIAEMSEPLEEFAKELIIYQVAIDEDILQLLNDSTVYMSAAVDSLEHGGEVTIPKLDQFLARLNELRERAVGPLVRLKDLDTDGSNTVDPRLLSIFMAEEMTFLLDAESILDKWRDQQSGPHLEKISELITELITLREGANKANLPDIETLSETLRSVHDSVKSAGIDLTENFFERSVAGHNSLLDMIDSVAAGQNVTPPNEHVLQDLQQLLTGGSPQENDFTQDQDIPAAQEENIDNQDNSVSERSPLSDVDDLSAGHIAAPEQAEHGLEPAQEDDAEEHILQPADVDFSIDEMNTAEATSSELLAAQDTEAEETQDDKQDDVISVEQTESTDEIAQDLNFDSNVSPKTEDISTASLESDLELDILDNEQPSDDNSAPREYIELPESPDVDEQVDDPIALENSSGSYGDQNVDAAHNTIDESTNEAHEHAASMSFSSGEETQINQDVYDNSKTTESVSNFTESFSPSESLAPTVEITDDIYDTVEYDDPDFDQDIFEVFLEEADELTEELDEGIHAWESDWSDPKPADLLKRALHTLKGGARLANMDKLGDLTHDYESYIIATRAEDIDQDFFKNLQAYQDKVLRSVKSLHPSESIEPTTHTTESSSVGSNSVPEPASGPTDANNIVPFSPKSSGSSGAQEGQYSGPALTGGATNAPKGQAAAKRSGPQEVVKVPADLLEELVNLAGETSISRGRLEQQVTDFSHSLEEIDGTILRLQEQIRRLDIETEAQILFRQEQIAESDKNFDPLEMDRYSQLQQLSRSLIESASDLADLRGTLADNLRDTETLLLQQSRINSNLQEGLMRSRMVPFSRMVPRLRRIVRQVAAELGKNVTFELDNIEGELDRSVLERMVAPLEHMLRNAVDHGIELPNDRLASGKSDTGRIVLTLGREGGEVILRLADDGRGINLERVREKAIERGLMDQDATLSDLDVMQFILHAGFSTAENVTQISGRGVGMDVVHAEIKQLGGSVLINSQWNKGTEFTVRLPFTVSVNRALMVDIGSDFYAVPLNNIEGIVRVSPFELEHYYQNPEARFEYAGESYQVRYLGAMLSEGTRPKLEGQSLPMPVLLVRSQEHTMALQVDTLLGSREIVVKNLGQQFSSVLGLSGATLMGDGSVVVILDPHALVRKEMAQSRPAMALVSSEQEPVLASQSGVQTVMVVDDSVTVRKVTTRFLERQGYNVITAKDGVDALKILQDEIPDLMLLDIEMPRMDGFEVAKNVRTTSRWSDIPIIMITSRTGDKHREHAYSLGVNNYLGKPYQEEVLLESITNILGDISQ